MMIRNPILSGFYPDPSICRVGEWFYMVNSTFAYFPGIPVFRSRDLACWEQIGNVLERNSQVPLEGCGHSEGIYAPTIRYYEGVYYVIATNVSGGGNFIVTARQPEGPWSEPYFLGEKAQGIDPSLFFDEDGSCYYIGQRENSRGSRYFGDCEIWIQKLDLERMELVGESHPVLYGFEKNAVWPEGPHLYKKDGWYYILHAEGGTERNHCIAAARSREVFGPYEYCPANPILTHRHLGKDYPVTCVGHGDLTEDGQGNWYMVMLGSRPEMGYTLLGRETFLAKVVWEDGWPVVNPGIGRLETSVDISGDSESSIESCLKEAAKERLEFCDQEHSKTYTFENEELPPEFLLLRNPKEGMILSGAEGAFLRMHRNPAALKEQAFPCYAALRFRDRSFEVETELELKTDSEGHCGGIALVQSNDWHFRLECYTAPQTKVRLTACQGGKDTALGELLLEAGRRFQLRVIVDGLYASFFCRTAEKSFHKGDSQDPQIEGDWKTLMEKVDLRPLSTENAGGFVGCTAGMYASGNGRAGDGYVDFAWFSYKALKKQSIGSGAMIEETEKRAAR